MIFSGRRGAALLVLAAALTVGSGCNRGGGSGGKSTAFAPLTTGSAEQKMAYMDGLSRRFIDADPASPTEARKLLMDYTSAMIGTSESILKDKTADKSLRERAAGTILAAWGRRKTADPKAIKSLIAAAEKIEEENPKTMIATIAAFEKAKALGEIAQRAPESERLERYRELGEAALHVGRMTPSPSIAPELLNKVGKDAEILGQIDLARDLFATLAERFPDDKLVEIAKGTVLRIDSIGKPLEGFEGEGRDGTTITTKDFLGKVLVVDFWATGCVPCVNELPEIVAFGKAHATEGLAMLGVCIDPDKREGIGFLADQKIDWPHIFSPTTGQTLDTPLGMKFGVQGIPFKLVFDREGKLIAFGYVWKDLKPKVEALLKTAEKTATPPAPKAE